MTAISLAEPDAHRAEVQALIAKNEVRRACDRLLDFARDYSTDAARLREALSLSRDLEELRDEERRYGQTDGSRSRRRMLIDSLLQLVDLLHEKADLPETPTPRALHLVQPAAGDEPKPDRLSLEEDRQRFLAGRDGEAPDPTLAYQCSGVVRGHKGGVGFRLGEIELELRPGEITGLVGVNGAGKTTLLRIVAGELLPDDGHYLYPLLAPGVTDPARLDWRVVRSQIAHVRQRPHRWFGRVVENLYHEAAWHGLRGQANRDHVDFFLQRLGLERYRHARWSQLSGGFKLRFELAKALVSRPRLLILDEPLAPLDIDTQLMFLQDLRDLAASARHPLPILISSQHLYETETVADKLLFLVDGQPEFYGPVEQIGANREENAFELSVAVDKQALLAALGHLAHECHRSALQTFLVRTPLTTLAAEVLRRLVDAGIAVSYFRDVSRSTRTLFDSAREQA